MKIAKGHIMTEKTDTQNYGIKTLAREVIEKMTARKEIRTDVSGLMIGQGQEFQENFSRELDAYGHVMTMEEGKPFVCISFRDIFRGHGWWQNYRENP